MGIVVTVALAGTPEAETADYVCDGIDDDVEINAAIAAVAGAGGGTVRIAAGEFSTSRPIAVFGDGVAIEGKLGGGTTITPAADWHSLLGPDGAAITGVVCFVGANNFAARNLTIESGGSLMNGLIAIPTGPLGAGEVCVNGVFENNLVRMAQGHTYSIWSLRSQDIEIIGNVIEGGATPELADPHQEGIEIYGGRDVLISGNSIAGIGNAAINVGGLAAQTPDSSVERITIVDNSISSSRVGVFVGTTWGSEHGPAHARDILVEDNYFVGLFEAGFLIRNWTGNVDAPPETRNIVFRGNEVDLLYSEAAGFTPVGLWFRDGTQPGETIQSSILVEGNSFHTSETSAVPTRVWLYDGHSAFLGIESFTGVSFIGNSLDLLASGENSRGILVYYSDDVTVRGNEVSGAGLHPIEFYQVARFSIDANTLSGWGRGRSSPGISIGQSSEFTVTDNALHQPNGGAGPSLISIFGSDVPLGSGGNLWVVEQDASLAGSLAQHLTLAGLATSGTGNALDNVITGNSLENRLDGAGGVDVLVGLGGGDLYFVDAFDDVVIEAAGDNGRDVVYASVDYRLPAGTAIEVLSAWGHALTTPLVLTGNELTQEVWGNAGANVIDGGGGNDTLVGLGGGDTYYVNVSSVRIVEAAGADGRDVVYASVDFRLNAGAHVEVLSARGHALTTSLSLTGNELTQEVWGNAGANVIDGGGGNDTLVGLGGGDTYYVDAPGVWIVEAAGADGRDVVYASVDYRLNPGAHVEVLSARGHALTTPLSLAGNELTQEVWGNAGANVLDGGGGNDTLIGLGGADTFAFTSAPGPGNVSLIADFELGLDRIALDDAVFAGLSSGALPASAFVLGSSAADADDRILYDPSTGALYFDPDGNGAAAAIQFATLAGNPTLSHTDFIIM